MKQKPIYLLLLLVATIIGACSVERNNPLSKTYHNTTARYNGYFLAKEKLRAVEEALQNQMLYDYNKVIPLYPTIDSTTAKAAAADLEDVVKKASFPIQYHKNSKWIDDSYIVIGRARYYQLDFADAARTFKYANTISKDKDTRHEAMVWLMRTYLQMDEPDNAHQVSELLRRERLNRDNARELYLARAQYHWLQGDTAAVIENLALSVPNFEEKDAESRVRFALAQLYQATGQDKEAYRHYSKILRRNPPYDLGFFSRLYIGQVSELSDEQDQERIAGFYEKMLKDEKNVEYKNKILYEMAQFELRKQNFNQALSFLQQSLRERGSLPNQNAYSYLLAGKIYFDHLGKYNMAQAYYDSAVQVYPKTAPEYDAVVERRDVLTSFANQYNTIQTQDSLQRLARMAEPERMAFLEQLVQQQEEERQQLAQQQAQQSVKERRQSGINTDDAIAFNPGTNSAGVWYFDNPAAMASARSEFIRRWGDRPLQDFWRIRSRGESGNQEQLAQQAPATATPDTTISAEARAAAQIQTYLQDIPLTTAALQKSEKMVEEALFTLGNIYNQNLKNAEKATATYEQLLQRFPQTEHAAETYYALYLLYNKADNSEQKQVYYNKIKQQFPNSTFAQLVDDSDFINKNAAENLKAHALYDSAYTFYEAADYKQAQHIINQLVSQYPHSDIRDKTAFLEAMITARTKAPAELRAQLERFKKDFPTSPLQANAAKLLETYTSLEQKNMLRKEAPALTAPKPKEATSSLTPEEKVSTIIASTAPVPTKVEPKQPETTLPVPADTAGSKAVSEPVAIADTLDLPDSAAVAASLPEPDPMAFSAEPDSAYYFVLIYPTGHDSFKDIAAKYEKYNSTYFRNEDLQVSEEPFADGKTMLLARTINDFKIAKSYNIKQKGPQAPVGRIRGVEFTTFVISSANFQKFMQKKDLEAYQTFFKNNY